MNILELSQTRFSARKYTDEAVSDDDLAYILECVQLAPSAVNRQPWKFVVVRSKEAKEQLALAGVRPRLVPHCSALHRVHEEQQRVLDTPLRRQAARRHRRGYSYRASVPRCNGAQPRHLLGVQLRYRCHEPSLPLCRLRGCSYHPRRTYRRRLSAHQKEA